MKIILLKDIPKVGKKYDIKDVAEGYATNMLLPKGLALIATGPVMARVQAEKDKADTEKKIQGDLLLKNLETIKGTTVTIHAKINDKGHLFAGITKERILEELFKQTRLNLDPETIDLKKPLKEVGEHKIEVTASGKKVEFTVSIVAEKLREA